MELWTFLKLYGTPVEVTEVNYASVIILAVLINGLEYGLDFYHLVKRKTRLETLAVMQLPLGFATIGAIILGSEITVPVKEGLWQFLVMLDAKALAWELLLIPFGYGVLLLIAAGLWNKRGFSYVTGGVLSLAMTVVSIFIIITGRNPFRKLPDLILTGYLYVVLFLLCKLAVLFTGTLVCVCTVRLKKPVWKEGKNPLWFFLRYEIFRQNALFRGILLFWVPLLALFAYMWSTGEADALRGVNREDFVVGSIFVFAAAPVMILLSLLPIWQAVRLFGIWGDRRKLLELFCQEYFKEEQEEKKVSYTVTGHFLVDEEAPAEIYCWEQLLDCTRGWLLNGRGQEGIIRFRDGRECVVPRENEQAESVMRRARLLYDPFYDSYGDIGARQFRNAGRGGYGRQTNIGIITAKNTGYVILVCLFVMVAAISYICVLVYTGR